jgi:hypothetical protein
MRHALCGLRTIAILALTALAPVAPAQQADAPETPVLRIGAALGAGLWPGLADLEPDLGGDFERTGFAGEVGLHAGGWRIGPADLYLGADFGFASHDSDVVGTAEREDLYASLLFVTPSLRARLGNGDRARWTLDAGAGYYRVSVDEWEDDCDWDCDTWEYYDDGAIGGYLGVGVEVALGSEIPFWLVASARAHFVGFEDPDELEAGGDLDGPIYVLSIGLAFYP